MSHHRKLRTVVLLVVSTVLTLSTVGLAGIRKHLTGKINDNVYTRPEKDFRILLPRTIDENDGGTASDQSGKGSNYTSTQVIFTNDLGTFFRVGSFTFTGPADIDKVLKMFSGIQDKQSVQTSRGREWRVIDLATKGSGIRMREFTPLGGSVRILDLLTANVIFALNGRVYLISAGHAASRNPDAREMEELRKELDTFRAGFEAIQLGAPVK
jgi:hypothetical protein